MAKPGRIVLNRRGMRELLRSPEVQADLERRAKAIADAAGTGEATSHRGRNRARASVMDTHRSRDADVAAAALLAALDAGRR